MKLAKKWMTAGATACLMIAPLAQAHETDKDDGPKVEKSFDYAGFDRVIIEGVYEVDIKVGPGFSIETSGSEKRMEDIKVTKVGDKLILGMKDTKRSRNWNGHNSGIHAIITMPSLDEISLQGVGSVEAKGIDSDDFKLSLEGVGSVELAGRCGDLDASVEGVGSLEATDLECENVNVDVEGMGSAEVYASTSVDANIEGMGSIDVEGSPKNVSKSKSFMSSIDIR